VAYDVREPARLRLTHRTMLGFGDPMQYSLFTCQLSPKERVMLLDALSSVINAKEDRVVIIDLGPSDGAADRLEFMGETLALPERQASIF
jgi:CRISPR-associated protein Cas2